MRFSQKTKLSNKPKRNYYMESAEKDYRGCGWKETRGTRKTCAERFEKNNHRKKVELSSQE